MSFQNLQITGCLHVNSCTNRMLEMMPDAPTNAGKHVMPNNLHVLIAKETQKNQSSDLPKDVVHFDVT